jgi:hypothetical protein
MARFLVAGWDIKGDSLCLEPIVTDHPSVDPAQIFVEPGDHLTHEVSPLFRYIMRRV